MLSIHSPWASLHFLILKAQSLLDSVFFLYGFVVPCIDHNAHNCEVEKRKQKCSTKKLILNKKCGMHLYSVPCPLMYINIVIGVFIYQNKSHLLFVAARISEQVQRV